MFTEEERKEMEKDDYLKLILAWHDTLKFVANGNSQFIFSLPKDLTKKEKIEKVIIRYLDALQDFTKQHNGFPVFVVAGIFGKLDYLYSWLSDGSDYVFYAYPDTKRNGNIYNAIFEGKKPHSDIRKMRGIVFQSGFDPATISQEKSAT